MKTLFRKFTPLFIFLPSILLTMVSCSKKEKKDIVIVYTSDVHGYIANNGEDALRYSNVAAYVNDLKKEGKEVLLVDGGDHMQGSPYTVYDKGSSIIDIMNEVGYDLAVIGNHEFDFGMEALNANIAKANYPYISCNFKHKGNRVYDATKTFKIGNVTIGFVGVTTPQTIVSSTPVYFQNDTGTYIYSFDGSENCNDLYDTFQNSVDSIKNKVDYVIGLGHIGVDFAEQETKVSCVDLVKNTKGVDAFISAHSHLQNEMEAVKNKENKDIVLTEAGSNLDCFGVMEIKKDGTITTKLVKNYANSDEKVKAKEEAFIKEVDDSLSEKIAETDNTFYINNSENPSQRIIRSEETNLGDLISDSYYWYFNENSRLNCDISVTNGGGLRSTINPGDITKLTIKSVLPFDNIICLLKASGQEIKDALEMGCSEAGLLDPSTSSPYENGGFLHVAGMKFTVDASITSTIVRDQNGDFVSGPIGDYKVKDIEIYNKKTKSYEPIDLSKEYTVAGTNYLLHNGGNGLTMFKDNELVIDFVGQEYVVACEYISAFTKKGEYPNICTDNSPIFYENYLMDLENPKGSNRINIINKQY